MAGYDRMTGCAGGRQAKVHEEAARLQAIEKSTDPILIDGRIFIIINAENIGKKR